MSGALGVELGNSRGVARGGRSVAPGRLSVGATWGKLGVAAGGSKAGVGVRGRGAVRGARGVRIARADVGVGKDRAGVGEETACAVGGGSAVSSTYGVGVSSAVGIGDAVSERVGSAVGVGRARGGKSGGRTRVGVTLDWAGFNTTTREARTVPPGWRTPLTRTSAPTVAAPRDWSTRVPEDLVTRVLPTIQPEEVMRSMTPPTVTEGERAVDDAKVGRLSGVGRMGAGVESVLSAVGAG